MISFNEQKLATQKWLWVANQKVIIHFPNIWWCPYWFFFS